MTGEPFIPEKITVHLGAPDDRSAMNVTVDFVDYIKNVGSSELYPTWPEAALRANLYAIISFALNRIYTEWYPSQGYDFDITSTTQYDQKFIENRYIFENIAQIVDDIFNNNEYSDASTRSMETSLNSVHFFPFISFSSDLHYDRQYHRITLCFHIDIFRKLILQPALDGIPFTHISVHAVLECRCEHLSCTVHKLL